MFFALLPMLSEKKVVKEEKIVIDTIKTYTTEERIAKVLSDSGFSLRMQRIIVAQAKLESGCFNNNLTKKHNNLFGMRHPRIRKTYSIGAYARAEKRNGYASYNSIDSCVTDFIYYYRSIKAYDTTVEQYVKHIKKKGYFEANEKQYVRSLIKLMEN